MRKTILIAIAFLSFTGFAQAQHGKSGSYGMTPSGSGIGFMDARYVNVTGDTMTGNLDLDQQLIVVGSATFQNPLFSVGGSTLATYLGNVGIGRTDPSSPLHINQGGITNGIMLSTAIVGANTVYLFYNSNGGVVGTGSGNISLDPDGRAVNIIDEAGSDAMLLKIYNGATAMHWFNSNGVSYLNGGDLAIGHNAPAYGLHTVGNVFMTTATVSNGVGLFVEAGTGDVGIGTTEPSEALYVVGNSSFTGIVTASMFNAVGTAYQMNGVTLYDSDGNLFVANDADISGRLSGIDGAFTGFIDVSSLAVTNAMSADDIVATFGISADTLTLSGELYVNGTGDSWIMGDVGISTTTPSQLLHLFQESGNTNQVNECVSADCIALIELDNDATRWQLRADGGDTDNFIIKNVAGGDFVSVDTSGNVGIGVTNPLAPLHVSGGVPAATAQLRLEDGTGTGNFGSFSYDNSGNSTLGIFNTNTGAGKGIFMGFSGVGPHATAPMLSLIQGTGVGISTKVPAGLFDVANLFVVESGGNVGIGLTNPVGTMTVAGMTFMSEFSTHAGSTAGYGQFWVKDDAPTVAMFTNDNGEASQITTKDDAHYAEMTIYNNSTPADIETQSVWHGTTGLLEGNMDGHEHVTFHASSVAYCGAFYDYSGVVAGTILAECYGHGMTGTEYVTIVGATDADYNGVYEATVVSTGSYYFTNANWDATATATSIEPSHFHIDDAEAAGIYTVSGLASITPEINNDEFDFAFFVNETAQTDSYITHKSKTAGDYSSVVMGFIVDLAVDDNLWVGMMNLDGSGDVTVKHANLSMHKIR